MKPALRRGPTAGDLSRLAIARASSRLSLARARDAHAEASLAAFRAEIGATVRHASPFLMAFLDKVGLSIEHVAREFRPAHGWPYRPGLPTFRQSAAIESTRSTISIPGAGYVRMYADPLASLPGVHLVLSDGTHLHVRVVDQSIEVAGRIGAGRFVTLFGALSMRLPGRANTQISLILGRQLEEAIELPGCLSKGWKIASVGPDDGTFETEVVVRTGRRRCKLPCGG